MNKQNDSFYGWVFTGVDASLATAQKYPRDLMIEFTRPNLMGDTLVVQQLSVPRYDFVDEVVGLPNDDVRKPYFKGLKRQVDFGTQDVCPVFYESIA